MLTTIVLSAILAAQGPGVVEGRVVDQEGSPVGAALVEITRTRESKRTSPDGRFSFRGIDPGIDTLRVRAVGYRIRLVPIVVSTNAGWSGTVAIERVPQPLPEVGVKGRTVVWKPSEYDYTAKYDDFFRRRHLGIGTFRSWEDLQKLGVLDLAGVLQSIPGVTVSSFQNPYGAPEIRIRMARCSGMPPRIAIYLDGQKLPLFGKYTENAGSDLRAVFSPEERPSTCDDCTRIAELLSSIRVSEIEFIEFYRGPGQIPAELERGDACSALVIWRK